MAACKLAECPQNCKTCQTDNSATVATCTDCVDDHKLIKSIINGVTVAGNCYSMYIAEFLCLFVFLVLFYSSQILCIC